MPCLQRGAFGRNTRAVIKSHRAPLEQREEVWIQREAPPRASCVRRGAGHEHDFPQRAAFIDC